MNGVIRVDKVNKIEFEEFRNKENGKEGIVLLGAGGDLLEWVFGVTGVLKQEGIIPEDDYTKVWEEAYVLTTSGGRHDLALVFNNEMKFDLGKMAMWRIRFGECSWISHYVVNYEDQHMGA